MQRVMLYAHRNTASDNRVRCERKVQQKEGSKNAGFPQFILRISRQKVYCLKELELTLNFGYFFCVFLGFGYKITEKPRIPSDNLVPASRLSFISHSFSFSLFPNLSLSLSLSLVKLKG